MNYAKWMSILIFVTWFLDFVARFVFHDVSAYLKLCAGNVVMLLCIIALNVVWLREKK